MRTPHRVLWQERRVLGLAAPASQALEGPSARSGSGQRRGRGAVAPQEQGATVRGSQHLSQQLRVKQQVSSRAMSDLHPAVPAEDWQDGQDWALPREKLIPPEVAPRPTRTPPHQALRMSPGPEGEKSLSRRKAAPGRREAASSWSALWRLDFF